MNIQSGYFYHIKDDFFEEVQDSSLMANKEDGNYRPHYLAIQESQNPGIYWMVPVSSKFEKYQNIYSRQVALYKKMHQSSDGGKIKGRNDTAFCITERRNGGNGARAQHSRVCRAKTRGNALRRR